MTDKILMAIDVNDRVGAANVAKNATDLAAVSGDELHVANIIPDAGMTIVSSYLGPDHSKKMLAEAKAALLAWRDEEMPSLENTQLHVVQGTIYDKIISTANQIGASKIVIGAHRPELKDYLIGPNAARVVRHFSGSVLVVR